MPYGRLCVSIEGGAQRHQLYKNEQNELCFCHRPGCDESAKHLVNVLLANVHDPYSRVVEGIMKSVNDH